MNAVGGHTSDVFGDSQYIRVSMRLITLANSRILTACHFPPMACCLSPMSFPYRFHYLPLPNYILIKVMS
jgi:hypothetical protein